MCGFEPQYPQIPQMKRISEIMEMIKENAETPLDSAYSLLFSDWSSVLF
jgi:hypothetical protein